MGRTSIFWCNERVVGADVADAARSAFASAMLSVRKRSSLCANCWRVLRRCLRRFAFLMCFSRADNTVSDMLNIRFVDSDVGVALREIEVGGFGLSSSMRSENLFEEGCIACDDC